MFKENFDGIKTVNYKKHIIFSVLVTIAAVSSLSMLEQTNAELVPTLVQFYDSPAERSTLINSAESANLELYFDDHVDARGGTTDGTEGRLSFGPIRDTSPSLDELRLEQLKQNIRDRSISNAEIIEYLELRDGL